MPTRGEAKVTAWFVKNQKVLITYLTRPRFSLLLSLPLPLSLSLCMCVCVCSLARDEMGWTAKLGLDEMCRDLWAWQSQNPKGFSED